MDQRGLWQSVIGEIELSVPKASFEALFKKVELVSIDGSNVEIAVPNVFIQTQLQGRYKGLIPEILTKNGVIKPKIHYRINLKTINRAVSREVFDPILAPTERTFTEEVVTKPQAGPAASKTGLNPRYTFENFIVGSSNDFAYSACQAIVDNPGTKYNPLFLYSGVGLGKTHLIQAIGNQIIMNDPSSRVLYITMETFINEFVHYIRFKDRDFSSKYRNVDVLIVDDMQFIAGKEKIQEEFFHTFNELHQKNKQIIITSDKPPKSIPTLTERLRSRFEWGMMIDIQMPDFETRCAILEAKAHLSGVELEKPTVEYLANNFRTNIRELEGALNQLLAYSEMRGVPPTIETAEGLLEGSKASRPHHLTAKQVVIKTASYFDTSIEEIKSPSRTREIVRPRQIAMYLLRSELHLSYPKISTELGRKDHTTAIHSIDKIEKEIKLNPSVREHVNSIREALYN